MGINKEKIIKDNSISAIKDTLKQGLIKWKDTGGLVTYEELLNVFEFKEPLTIEEAKKLYSSFSNDSRLVKTYSL